MTSRICYVHAGTGKTGSSAIQYALTVAAGALRGHGYLYPDIANNFKRVLDLKPTAGNALRINKHVHDGEVDQALELIRPYAEQPFHLLLSSEGFANVPGENLAKFGEGLRALGYVTRSLVFFRHQYDFVVSSYLQQIKTDKMDRSLSVRDYALQLFSSPRNAWHWLNRAQRIKAAFGDITVKWYPAVVRQGSNAIVDVTSQWLGVPSLAGSKRATIINPTPGLEALHVLMRLNSQERGGKRVADAILMRAQEEGVLGSKVVLDAETVRFIHSTMYESNVALLERFCPELSPLEELKLPELPAEQPRLDPGVVQRLETIAAQVLDQLSDVDIQAGRRVRNLTRRRMLQRMRLNGEAGG